MRLNPKNNKWEFFIGILFSIMISLGFVINKSSKNETIAGYIQGHLLFFFICFIFFSLLFYLLLVYFFKKIDLIDERQSGKSNTNNYFLIVFFAIFFCWIPYLLVCYPTITRGFDYFWQLLQGIGVFPYSNHHPVFSSFIFGLLYRIGNSIGGASAGLFFTSLVQLIVMALVLSICFYYLRVVCKVNPFVLRIIIGFICICPIFPTNVIWVIKDSIFSSLCILLFFQLFMFAWCINRKLTLPKIVSFKAITITSVLFSLYRNGVVAIAVFVLVIIIIVAARARDLENEKKQKLIKDSTVCIFAFIVVMITWNVFLNVKNVYPTNVRESLAMPTRQLIRSIQLNSAELNNDDRKIFEKVYIDNIKEGDSFEEIIKKYDDTNADPIKVSFIEDNNTLGLFIQEWWKWGVRHPGCYLDASARGTSGYWWPGQRMFHVVFATEISIVENDFANKDMVDKTPHDLSLPLVKSLEHNDRNTNVTLQEMWADYPELKEIMTVQSKFPLVANKIKDKIEKLVYTPGISIIFIPGTYTWIMLGCLGYLFSRKRIGRCMWPALLIIALACLSPINGYTRYVFSIELISLILIAICFIPNTMYKEVEISNE